MPVEFPSQNEKTWPTLIESYPSTISVTRRVDSHHGCIMMKWGAGATILLPQKLKKGGRPFVLPPCNRNSYVVARLAGLAPANSLTHRTYLQAF